MRAQDQHEVVLVNSTLVDQQHAERGSGRPLLIERARQLVVRDETFGQENLAQPHPRYSLRGTRWSARFDCHAAMLDGLGLGGNRELPNLVGTLSYTVRPSIPRQAGTMLGFRRGGGSFVYLLS
jgi:hypothetical protein